MRPRRRWIPALALGLGALVAALWVALPWLSRTDAVRRRVAAALAAATGWDVRVERFGIGWDLEATLEGLTAAAAGPPFLRAERVRAWPGLGAALHGRLAGVELDEPVLVLGALPTGNGDGAPTSVALPASVVIVRDARVQPRVGEAQSIGPLSFTVDSIRAGRGLELRGRAGPAGEDLHARWHARLDTALETVHATIRARTDAPVGGVAGGATLVVEGSPRGRLEATLRATVTPSGEAAVRVRGRGAFDVGSRSGEVRLEPVDGEVDLGGWSVSGALAASLRSEAGGLVASPDLTLAFHDRASAHAGEALRLTGTVRVADTPGLVLDVGATAGELLWGRFYVDLAARPLHARGGVGWNDGAVVLRALTVSLADDAAATLDGRWDLGTGVPRLDVGLDIPRLGPLFDVALREPYEDGHPILAGATLAGRLGGTLRLRGDAVTGRLRLSAVSARATDPALAVTGLEAELPVSLGEGAAAPADPAGHIRVAGLALGDVRVPAISVGLHVAPNTVRATDAVEVAVLGGRIDVSDLAVALAGPGDRARFGVRVRDVDLAKLTTALGWPALGGMVSATIPTVAVGDGGVRTAGEVAVAVFEGHARIRNLHVDELWSPVPAVGLDLDFEDVSLGDMTQSLDVGQITGVVRGFVHDLSIANGQPVGFEAALESVPRDGVPQEISVRAIRQISIVAGPGGDALSSGILAFFDRYRYAKLGFRCSLHNDRFVLHGTEEHEGKQVLVEGSFLPPRVNVYSESRVIAFSEMMRRLRRAVETGAAEGGSD